MVVQIYSPAPHARSFQDDKPTLLITYWCAGSCLVMIVWRTIGRLLRANTLYSDDKMMLLTVIPLCIRQALVHFVLLNGTNNVATEGLTLEEIEKREIGSRFVLAARVVFAMFVWSQKLCITEFFTKMTDNFWTSWQEFSLKVFKIYLGVSFMGTMIALLAQCQPFEANFQVVPDPGPLCRQAAPFLLTHTSQMIFIDIFLALFPLPMILRSRMTYFRKFCLTAVFSSSLLLVLLSCFKIPVILKSNASQQLRTLLASFECLSACAVANLVVLLSFVRDTGPKRRKFRTESDAEKSLRAMPGNTTDWWSTHDRIPEESDLEDYHSYPYSATGQPSPLQRRESYPPSPFSTLPPPSPLYPPSHLRRLSSGYPETVSSFMPVPLGRTKQHEPSNGFDERKIVFFTKPAGT